MKFSEKAYVNKIAMTGHIIIITVLSAAYMLEWLKGSRSIGYFLTVLLVGVLPVILNVFVYRKNRESDMIRHIMGIGYGVLYVFALFTTNSSFTFVYALPMYIVITLFSDVRYCSIICSGGFLVNIADVAYRALTVGYTSEELPDVEIRIACMVLVGIFLVITTVANKKVHVHNMENLQEQQDKVQNLLDNVLTISSEMTGEIVNVKDKMNYLGESVMHIRDAMSEVNSGSNETAESVQNQMERTEEIQNHIVKVKDSAQFIEENMADTVRVVMTGKQQMDDLAMQVEKSMQANSQVIEKMQELNEYTTQMNTIIETITSIANSTGMLALNASIEAARAGEAGRGFAVVADQISGLANQTKAATVNITELIENINNELVNVTEAVDVVTESNRANADSTQTVADSFVSITEGADKVSAQTKELMGIVINLEGANADIVDKIQTISAITEEVSAHSNETYSDCEANNVMVDEITQIVTALNESAEKLKNVQ